MIRFIRATTCMLFVLLTGCAVTVDYTSLDFGSTETTKTFTLRVVGDVEWSIDHTKSWLTIEPDNGQGTQESLLRYQQQAVCYWSRLFQAETVRRRPRGTDSGG